MLENMRFQRILNRCMWTGCDEKFESVMPPGWMWYVEYNSPTHIAGWDAQQWADTLCFDYALCPKHAAEFRSHISVTYEIQEPEKDGEGSA